MLARTLSFLRSLRFAVLLLGSLIAVPGRPLLAQEPDEPRQAIPMSPSEYAQKLQLAEVYEERRDATSAARLYGELFTIHPNDPVVFDGYTRSLMVLKRYDEAENIVKRRLDVDGSLDMQLLYARLEARMNKRSEALDAFHKAETDVNAHDCAALFPIVYAMMDVSYNQDALELLDHMRQNASQDADICSSQIAGLYLRLGDFDRASKEFIAILKSGEGNVGMVEQRLAEYLTDSLSRATVLGSLEHEILSANTATPSRANLRLLAWLYGEERSYDKALATIIEIDDLSKGEPGNEGPELLQFADRARSEGALEVAARAYAEAGKRLKQNTAYQGSAYFVAQAELGALKTWEAYYQTAPAPNDSIVSLVSQYEAFAAGTRMNDLALDALAHAGALAYSELFDLPRATRDFEAALAFNGGGMTDPLRTAAFGLVDIAYASKNFLLAAQRLAKIDAMLANAHSPNEKDIRDHIIYERALGAYYQLKFDTATTLLGEVSSDASSDDANDAISLAGIIQESNNPSGIAGLQHFALGALDEEAHDYPAAEAAYRSIIDSEMNAPLADDATLRHAQVLVKLGHPEAAVQELDSMQTKMLTSPLLDVAAFREAEIVEQDLHDKTRAEKLYEDFLARYPNSNFVTDARDRARKLRGDAF